MSDITQRYDPDTGELLPESDSGELVPRTEADEYADICDQLDILRLDRDAHELNVLSEDTHWRDLRDKEDSLLHRQAEIRESVQEVMDRTGIRSLEVGRLKVTVPKRRVTWSLARNPKEIAGVQFLDELTRIVRSLLDMYQPDGLGEPDRTADLIAEAVLSVLSPKPKTGGQESVKITVRPPKEK